MRRVVLALWVLGALSGCGDSSAAGTLDAAPPPCEMTLSGAFTGTFGCVASASEQDGSGVSVMGFVASGLPPGLVTASASFTVAGAPADKTYQAIDFSAGGALVQTSDHPAINYNAGVGATPTGTIDGFEVDLVQATAHNGNELFFIIHGSFSGTLVDDTGDSVKMTATF